MSDDMQTGFSGHAEVDAMADRDNVAALDFHGRLGFEKSAMAVRRRRTGDGFAGGF